MLEFLAENNCLGLLVGLLTFLIIGLFHPLVIKGEYYFGVKCWWVFLLAGLVCVVLSVLAENQTVSSLLGVVAFSCFWSIKEVFDQRKRVEKGWFPKRQR
jgi:branched-subunit amino acid transport protein